MMLDIASVTNAGGRPVNEDCVGYAEANGTYCLIVADGVGGYEHGQYASRLAADRVRELFLANPGADKNDVERYMASAAHHVSHVISCTPGTEKMKTTLSVLCLNQRLMAGGNVGDSRIYVFHRGKVCYLSRDHSLVMKMMLNGELRPEEMRGHPKRNVLTSAIGKTFPRELDIAPISLPLSPQDGILLCTDGFWELILEDEMLETMNRCQTASQWLSGMEQLVGNRQSGRSDNYTCLTARIKKEGNV